MRHITFYASSINGAHCFLSAILIMMSAFAFTSCVDPEDTDQSMVLSGEWRGDFGMFYDYIDRYGRRYTFDSYDTRLTFIPAYSYASHGRGTQVDYYDDGPYEYQYYKFSWSVRNGNIYLTYDYDPDLNTRISNYRMTSDYFSGVFASSGTTFRLYKIADYYNWTPYVNIYGYSDRYDWEYGYLYDMPYSRSSNAQPSDSTSNAGEVVGRGRRSTSLKQ